jgi:hypothetical protein
MGITTLDSRYTINGAINTDRSVLDNLSTLASACGTWITYDTHEGKFAVVINKAGTSSHSFTDDNIIGPIKLSLTPLDKIYNTVKVVYPHEDLKGKTDFIQISIPAIERLANEYENVLNLNYQVVTNPVQAQLLSFIELKQSRVDKVITFTTDFSKIGVKAGDLIDVTNATLGFTSKVFRVITVSEADSDAGAIEINITALEYDASVYDESTLSRYVRTDSDGITPLSSLQAPTKPTIAKTELAQQPSLAITTSLVSGLVDTIEFWSSPDVAMTEADRLYTLLRAQPSGSASFPLSTPITINVDTASASSFVVKCRAVNKDGVSEFSLPSDTTVYNPVQVPGAVTDATLIKNNDGSSISGMMTTAALLKLLNTFLKPSGSGGTGIQTQVDQGILTLSTSSIQSTFNTFTGSSGTWDTNWPGYPASQDDLAVQSHLSFTSSRHYSQMVLTLQSILANYDYKVKIGGAIEVRSLYAFVPMLMQVFKDGTKLQETTVDWQTQNSVTAIYNAGPGTYDFYLSPLATYDLDQEGDKLIFPYNFTVYPQASGGGMTLSILGYQ